METGHLPHILLLGARSLDLGFERCTIPILSKLNHSLTLQPSAFARPRARLLLWAVAFELPDS